MRKAVMLRRRSRYTMNVSWRAHRSSHSSALSRRPLLAMSPSSSKCFPRGGEHRLERENGAVSRERGNPVLKAIPALRRPYMFSNTAHR